MIQQKVFILIILLLISTMVPVCARANPNGEAIEMIDSSRTLPTSNKALPTQPIAVTNNEVSAKPSTVKFADIPSNVSWWSNLAEMVGLAYSDSGLTIIPTASHNALSATDYIIGPGDVIGISVWKDESLTRT